MEIINNRMYVVLTGDLIKSSKYSLEEKQAAFQTLRESTTLLKKIDSGIETIGIESFRGDSWQLLTSQPQFALNTAFLLRSALKMKALPDTRIAIGVGTAIHVPSNQLAEASGSAFELSGKGLDSLKKNMIFKIDMDHVNFIEQIEAILNASVQLASRLADQWSQNEARAVYGAIQGMKQVDIGQLWINPIRQQSVQDALYRAGWAEINALCSGFKKYIDKVIK